MMPSVKRLIAGSAIGAFCMMGAVQPSFAQAAYDGIWSVVVITESGTCDRAYRYPLRIARGKVTHANQENSSFIIDGRVASGGAVKVSVSRGNQRADGAGRLSQSSGMGKWKAASGECSGIWTAERRQTAE